MGELVTTINIVSGTMPAGPIGSPITGYFVTDYIGTGFVQIDYSDNGINWQSGGASVSFLGDSTPTSGWTEPDPGEYAVISVSITPTIAGTDTLYIRAYLVGDTYGPGYATPLYSYTPVINSPAISFETAPASGGTWTATNGVRIAIASDAGMAIAVIHQNRYVRMNGTTVFDQGAAGTSIFKFDAEGTYQWKAYMPITNASLNSLRGNLDGLYYLWVGNTAPRTLVSANGSTLTVAAQGVNRTWNITKLSNAGVWIVNTTMVWSNTNVVLTSADFMAGDHTLGVGFSLGSGAGTLTYGTNAATLSWGAGSIQQRPGVVVFDTTTAIAGVFGNTDTSATSNASLPRLDMVNGGIVWAYTDNAAASRICIIRHLNSAGTLTGTGSLSCPNGVIQSVSAKSTGAVFSFDRSAAAGGLSWSNPNQPGYVLTIPASQAQTVRWALAMPSLVNNIWATTEAQGATRTAVDGGGVLLYADSALNNVRGISWSTGASLWQASKGTESLGILTPTADHDADGVLFFGVATIANSTTLTDADFANSYVLPANRSWVLTINADGQWSKRQGDVETPGGPGVPPDPPESLDWPATLSEGDSFAATVTGYDPNNTLNAAVLEVLSPTSGVWIPNPVSMTFPGKGTLYVTKASPEIDSGAIVSFTGADNWYGTLRVDTRWVVLDPGAPRTSAITRFTTVYTNVPEKVTDITGELPDCNEDTYSEAYFYAVDPDNTKNYTWRLSPQTTAPYTTTGTTVNIYDGVELIGVASIIAENDALYRATVRFTPAANWSGSTSFSISVNNNSGDGYSAWQTVYVTVDPVADTPSALSPTTFPTADEDQEADITQEFTWTDPDIDPEDPNGSYQLQLALDIPEYEWLDINVDDTLNLGDVVIRLTAFDEDALTLTLRAEPNANWFGTYSVKARIVDTTDTENLLYGAAVVITGEVTSVADAPARVFPSTMPRCRSGETVFGSFATIDVDPDNTSWTFTFSAEKDGVYTGHNTSIAFSGIGTATLLDANTSELTCQVRMVADGGSDGRYQFWIKVEDSDGLESEPTLVTGYVTGAQVGGTIGKIDRGAGGGPGSSTLVPVAPIASMSSASIMESLDGPGSATFVMSADEARRRAADLGITVAELFSPSETEIGLNVGAQPLWVGPVTSHEYDVDGDGTITIYAEGLMSYFDARIVQHTSDPNGSINYVADDQSDIIWDLVEMAQAKPYGDLLITNGTVPSGATTTITFENLDTLSEAFAELRKQLNAAEVWIDPDRTLRAAPLRGADKRNLVRLSEGNSTRITRATSVDDIATEIIVTAGNNNSHHGIYANTAAMEKYGRITKHYHIDNLSSDASCLALATYIGQRMAQPVEAYKVTFDASPLRPFSVSDIQVGDVITLDVEDPALGRIRGDMRVINRSVQFIADTSDSYQVELDLETAVFVDGVLQGSRARHNPEVFEQLYEALFIQQP